MSGPITASTIIARAPLRISFAGGGTDLPAYYEQHGGMVLNAAITRSVYAVLAPGGYDQLHIVWSNFRSVQGSLSGHDDRLGPMSLPWAVAQAMGLEKGASVFLASEVPQGTGLGSSSTTASALIAAVAHLQGKAMTPSQIAELAADIEITRLGQPIGKQDQYAAAHGGLNVFEFSMNGVTTTPVQLTPEALSLLEGCLTLYFTGSTRQASTILQEQRTRTASGETRTLDSLHAIKAQVGPMREAIEHGNIAAVGALLDEAWTLKRRVSSGISTGPIDDAYAAARGAGALGGKITGAGGGGFMLLVVPPTLQDVVEQALTPLGLQRMPFRIEPRGAHVVQTGPT